MSFTNEGLRLLVGTTKGAFVLEPTRGRTAWTVTGPHFIGAKVHDFRLDPRDGRTLLLTSTGGHLGPTLFVSTNGGRRFVEATTPPAFEKGRRSPKTKTAKGLSVGINFWISPGHESRPGEWYAGTSPPGLFRSTDGGMTWAGVPGINDSPLHRAWFRPDEQSTPDGSGLIHSVCVDPRDADHLYISASSGGTFESVDGGKSFRPLNAGVAMDFHPGPPLEFGHDPHSVELSPSNPDVLYQQNHCGVYRLDRSKGETWERIGKKLPKKIGDIGFPIVVHPTDENIAWVFPMDGTKEWSRTPPGGKPAVYQTRNGGRSWTRHDDGFPASQAWLTVKRQCMTLDDHPKDPAVYLGTSSGAVFGSVGKNGRFALLAEHLPHIYSLNAVRFR